MADEGRIGLRVLREAARLSQARCAYKADLRPERLSRLEQGHVLMRPDEAEVLSGVLKVDASSVALVQRVDHLRRRLDDGHVSPEKIVVICDQLQNLGALDALQQQVVKDLRAAAEGAIQARSRLQQVLGPPPGSGRDAFGRRLKGSERRTFEASVKQEIQESPRDLFGRKRRLRGSRQGG